MKPRSGPLVPMLVAWSLSAGSAEAPRDLTDEVFHTDEPAERVIAFLRRTIGP